MKTILSALVAATMARITHASPVDTGLVARDESVIPYPIGLLGWEGPVTPGGPDVYYEGADIETINTQILADTPEASIFVNITESDVEKRAGHGSSPIEARQAYSQTCGAGRWGLLSQIDIQTGINYLYNVGRCIVQARQCIRTTCDQDSAIAWCNDNTYAIDVPCSTVADFASLAMWECVNWREIPFPNLPSTQRFHEAERWNIILSECGFFNPGGQPV
ncbi:hypothetical protein CSAL01_07888 [Colletotrichum salicis]|uniref:Secreted protein n=1 Tax=Colletotrichum salicis TaxID=1209931 RepID=A0A135V4N6_9PEZI|nr:hypothetical protein CSAL01_07888 [Colletotrichum salicis]